MSAWCDLTNEERADWRVALDAMRRYAHEHGLSLWQVIDQLNELRAAETTGGAR